MAGIGELSRAQRRFLVAFGKGEVVCGGEGWPEAMALGRWMRNGRFRRAYRERAGAIRRQIRLQLLGRALEAAKGVGGELPKEANGEKEASGAAAVGKKGASPAAATDKGDKEQGAKSKGQQQREFLQLIKLWMASERNMRGNRGKAKEEMEDGDMTFEEASLQLAHPNAPAGEVVAFFRKRAAEKGEGVKKEL